jgi:hypothetical protein
LRLNDYSKTQVVPPSGGANLKNGGESKRKIKSRGNFNMSEGFKPNNKLVINRPDSFDNSTKLRGAKRGPLNPSGVPNLNPNGQVSKDRNFYIPNNKIFENTYNLMTKGDGSPMQMYEVPPESPANNSGSHTANRKEGTRNKFGSNLGAKPVSCDQKLRSNLYNNNNKNPEYDIGRSGDPNSAKNAMLNKTTHYRRTSKDIYKSIDAMNFTGKSKTVNNYGNNKYHVSKNAATGKMLLVDNSGDIYRPNLDNSRPINDGRF